MLFQRVVTKGLGICEFDIRDFGLRICRDAGGRGDSARCGGSLEKRTSILFLKHIEALLIWSFAAG